LLFLYSGGVAKVNVCEKKKTPVTTEPQPQSPDHPGPSRPATGPSHLKHEKRNFDNPELEHTFHSLYTSLNRDRPFSIEQYNKEICKTLSGHNVVEGKDFKNTA